MGQTFQMAYDLSQLNVMVVDDNEHARKLVRAILLTLGVRQFALCSDGAGAFEQVANFKPDLMLTDWDMPGMDGVELVKKLRTDPASANPYLPVIMVSGHAERARVMQARDAGVTEYLVKPLSARLLAQRIQTVIEKPRPFVRTKSFFGPDRRRRSSLDFAGRERRAPQPSTAASPTGLAEVERMLEQL